ncbi:hypothetical protein [Paenibacillus sp. 2TAB19]|uniref:hypothetical protein n=1 Tax=Paenibacillus sp. 2TAB19 TaxID=3233003 RepID=UPI003F9ACDC7
MLKVKVVYEESGEDDYLMPVWMIIDCHSFDWNKTLYINIRAPFERTMIDDLDDRIAAIVPDSSYIRHHDTLGISLPHVSQADPALFNFSEIHRLMLRISDIEDVMQYDLRKTFIF